MSTKSKKDLCSKFEQVVKYAASFLGVRYCAIQMLEAAPQDRADACRSDSQINDMHPVWTNEIQAKTWNLPDEADEHVLCQQCFEKLSLAQQCSPPLGIQAEIITVEHVIETSTAYPATFFLLFPLASHEARAPVYTMTSRQIFECRGLED